ncbi:glycoside hydrolase family 19 protein [Pectobacterium sp. 21LCBS03]|uniref:glycoside hydrolase family 19 protein n=1 Tax=Pectobacterium sp. 21LCBS03 TaxID=2935858 RepID=UPI00200FCE76|nr:glycoside hydrolase family 19 protein [Pectobacterium sp. 21LCBS03]UPY96277.1 glycoside hydrolase family 19 protein [Pectobacterium sp. 21LCBS03]
MNIEQFRNAAGVSPALASRWHPHLIAAFDEFNIKTATEQAMFIAQVGHESGGFSRIVESLNYTPSALVATFGRRVTQYQADMLGRTAKHAANQEAIANLVYADRLGNKVRGDGWKYRGRGLIQVTGLDNYRACGTGLKMDLVTSPELLEQDSNAMRSAAWFWYVNRCGQYGSDVSRVTRIINGGSNGIDDRRKRFELARKVLL